ncbi:MAG: hypothetical protein AAB501_03665 [Patescibacteria group bacterium]
MAKIINDVNEEMLQKVEVDVSGKQELAEKLKQFKEMVSWFEAEHHRFGPNAQVDFVFGATSILESMGYLVDLDPGEMPS